MTTDAPPTTLAAFLLERYAEEVAVAHEAISDPWPRDYVENGEPWHCDEQSHHVAMAPARVLADLEAKRRIVELHSAEQVGWGPDVLGCAECHCDLPETWGPDLLPPGESLFPCDTLCLLALPYRDHPGFRPEWTA